MFPLTALPVGKGEGVEAAERRELAQRITAAREARGWSASTLAKQAGISPTTMSKVSNGEPVHPGTLAKVRETLGLQPHPEAQAPQQSSLDSDATTLRFPPDVELARELVGTWLVGKEGPERSIASSRLLALVREA